MRAIQVTALTGPAGLQLADAADPVGEVVIEVRAAGVSFPDLLLSKGEYQDRPELPFSPGVEVSGIVREARPGSALSAGDRVAAFVRRGGWAELASCRAEFAFPLPERISYEEGAALPLNYLTVHLALGRRARLRAGESVLVLGASGGIGTAAIQVAKAMGARTIAVSSSQAGAVTAERAGADVVVAGNDWVAQVQELTGGSGVDVVLDPVGGAAFDSALRLVKREGRLLIIGFASGVIPSVRVNRLLLRNIDLIGVAWGPTVRAQPGYAMQQWTELLALHAGGDIAPVLGGTYELTDAPQALRDLEAGRVAGKLILRVR
ncbi:MAG: NADPH:quinone oxidoreductase family protein [Streptosporangiaceae bacterium]